MSTPRKKRSRDPAGAIEHALRDLATALEASARPGMIIGGIAVIARGVVRLTKDIDATVVGGDTDLDALVAALAPYGIAPRIANAVSFAQESPRPLAPSRAIGRGRGPHPGMAAV